VKDLRINYAKNLIILNDETLHFALNTMRCRASFRVTINQRFSAGRWMLILQFAMRL